MTAKNGAINVTGLVVKYPTGTPNADMDGKTVTLDLGGDTYTATSSTTGVVFAGLNINLLEGTHNAVLSTNINTDGKINGVAVQIDKVVISGDFAQVEKTIGSKYLFVKAFPKLSLVSSKDNSLVVRITNTSNEDVTVTDFTAVNADPAGTTLNGQSVTSPIAAGKQVTLAPSQSTDLKLNITAAGTLKLTGLKYSVTDGTGYEYTITDDYTNIGAWGDFQTVYKS